MAIDNDITAEKLADKLFLDCLGFDCYSNSRVKFSASKKMLNLQLSIDVTQAFLKEKTKMDMSLRQLQLM